ncbi:MAG: Na+:solute symporter [Saprospirales bacterium]|nr:Na+:solute symporter [Saprospirales bacterium]
MQLTTFDWLIIVAFLVASLLVGLYASRKSGKNYAEFFLSGRSMPWWLLGFSMVATTFSADTPNLVTDFVRNDGVAGNWRWWAFLLTGMLTVFVYARMWRRSGVQTDLEFYEMRYSGKAAAFLRGFRAIYLGVLANCLIMATVILAAMKIGGVFGFSRAESALVACGITVVYSSIGGLTGVILTDFFQFIIAMIGSVWVAIVVVNHPEVGGLSAMLSHPNVSGHLNMLPDLNDPSAWVPLLLIPLAVQWWSVWYPGAEPGGGGYIAQRMLSAKNERHAIGATLFFNIAHYALRPWPWILVALGSLIIFPDLASLQAAFPEMAGKVVKDDLAYPAMLRLLPAGLLGLIVASLAAAFMSTIATHLNWGASYVVNDFYKRFLHPSVSPKGEVLAGRIITFLLMGMAIFVAFYLENAMQGFDILLKIGAGTGLIFLLRWFWWRINPFSELTAMLVSFAVAVYFEFFHPGNMAEHIQLFWVVGITTVAWLTVTFLTPPSAMDRLVQFIGLIRPHSAGWKPVLEWASKNGRGIENYGASRLSGELLMAFIGCITVYAALFCVGFWIYGKIIPALVGTVVALVGGWLLFRLFPKPTNT